MTQLTIRGISDELERELRLRADRERTSLNKTVVSLLRKATGLDQAEKRKRDLSFAAGSWDEAEAAEFDRAARFFEELDEELWQ
jgi:plasmid stability protein